MKDLITRATGIARQSAPATAAAAAAALSLGAYSGYAAGSAHHQARRHTFTLTVRTKALTLTPGSAARLAIVINRRHLRAVVSFRAVPKLPRGLAARFTPIRTRGKGTTLTIRAGVGVAAGHYRLQVQGRAGRIVRTITLTLNVVTPAGGKSASGETPPFSISGDVANPLQPGVTQPLDVILANPNALPLTVTNLVVSVRAITAPQSTPALPCSQSDFAIQQFSGPLPLTIPASSTRSLSQLGIPPAQWPQIAIVDLPTNQDGCRGASLGLGYAADARLG